MLDTVQKVATNFYRKSYQMRALAGTCKAVRVDTVKVGYGPRL